MKKLLAAAALSLCFSLPAQAAELFGIEFGSPASSYAISGEALAEQGKMKMYKVVPPKPEAIFPGYALTAYDGKVVRITAFSHADYSSDGAETRKLFSATVEKLTKLFGGPALYDDSLATDSKLTAPDQWKKSLPKRTKKTAVSTLFPQWAAQFLLCRRFPLPARRKLR